jgi:hypothetical protein
VEVGGGEGELAERIVREASRSGRTYSMSLPAPASLPPDDLPLRARHVSTIFVASK